MNPRDRKLRLRRSTVRNLTTDLASQVKGAVVIAPLDSLIFECPETRAFTNCDWCGATIQTCAGTCGGSCVDTCHNTCGGTCTSCGDPLCYTYFDHTCAVDCWTNPECTG